MTGAAEPGAALDWIDPADALAPFADDDCVVLFDSGGGGGARARFSYLCVEPLRVLRVDGGIVSVDGAVVLDDAFGVLASQLASLPAARTDGRGAAPFTGGAAGYIGYEMGTVLEQVPRAPGGADGVPDMLIGFFDVVFVFDHAAHALRLFAPDEARRAAVVARLRGRATGAAPCLLWRAMVTQAAHEARVRTVLGYIAAGDIYQANLTAGFAAERPESLDCAALYRIVRQSSPAPFGLYAGTGGGCAVMSASPERFVRLGADGQVETRPIKGTRPRGADAASDAALAAALLDSAKDRAENLMIVDLLRNDLARVADGVRVPSLFALESFAHVHHLVSAVEARMKAGLGAVDLLRAAFPGGSVTGAPKMRAMEIIAEVEGVARGPYCGAALWIGWDGAMDSNILIRTMVVGRGRVVARAGGGIVADSDPAEEWAELLVKIMPLLQATGMVLP